MTYFAMDRLVACLHRQTVLVEWQIGLNRDGYSGEFMGAKTKFIF